MYAYSAATVPKITVVLRKAYGGAYVAMCSKDLGADRVLAWPTAEIAVMGAEGAAEIVFRREIAGADDPAAKRAELIETYRETFSTPYVAASRGLVDDIIEPSRTREHVARALEMLDHQAGSASREETRVGADMSETVSAQQLSALLARVEALEAEVAELCAAAEAEVPEDVVLAISAAVAAYLGKRARVRQVRLNRGADWTYTGRDSNHRHQVRR